MTEADDDLAIDYARHEGVVEIVEWIRYTFEELSLSFDNWDDEFSRGPGMYVAIVSGRTVAEFADPMGTNRWPVDECPVIDPGVDGFYEAAETVAWTRDGAVVVSVDGVIMSQMVRFRDPVPGSEVESTDYDPWMGSRHMSALDTSGRPSVVATLTLSEEDGRVTVFRDRTYETTYSEDLGGRWRRQDSTD